MSIVPNDLKPYLINDAAADEALKSIKAASLIKYGFKSFGTILINELLL